MTDNLLFSKITTKTNGGVFMYSFSEEAEKAFLENCKNYNEVKILGIAYTNVTFLIGFIVIL